MTCFYRFKLVFVNRFKSIGWKLFSTIWQLRYHVCVFVLVIDVDVQLIIKMCLYLAY